MADGQVVLVLDIPQIILDVLKDLGQGTAAVAAPTAGAETHTMPPAGGADRAGGSSSAAWESSSHSQTTLTLRPCS